MSAYFRQLVAHKIKSSLLVFVLLASIPHAHVYAKDSCELLFSPKTVDALVKEKNRPSTEKVYTSNAEYIWKQLQAKKEVESDPKFYEVLEHSTLALLKELPTREVFFIARDGEWFFDAMTAVIQRYPAAHKLNDRIHLLNLSRPVAINSTPEKLMKYLEANGLLIEDILNGKSKVVLVDTGERGSIFIALFQKIIQTHDFTGKNWKTRLTNLLRGFDVQLLHSSKADNSASILKKWENMKSFNSEKVSTDLENLGFKTLIKEKRKSIGIPTEHYELHDWVVKEFERRKHWNGRATSINETGQVTKYENIDSDRTKALYNQAHIIWYFSQDSIIKKFQTPLTQALKGCGIKCSGPLKATPALNLPKEVSQSDIPLRSGLSLKEYDIISTPSESRYEILKFIDEGKRGRVYQARSLEGGKIVAIKVAVDKSADTLESFAQEAEKNKGYKLAGMPHAKLLEIGTDFMVKEFVSGVRADAWLETWVSEGMPSKTVQLKNLSQMLKLAAKREVYVGDLNPKNLIWDGKKWIIVDSGTWRNDLDQKEILERYEEKVISRWTKKLSEDVPEELKANLNLVAD